MAFCTNCGHEVSEQAPFCPNCGQPRLPEPVRAAVTAVGESVKETEGLAIASLVTSLAGLVLGPVILITAILAIVFGVRARERIRLNPSLQGDGMAMAGIIIGIVELVLALLIIVFIFSVIRAFN